LWMCDSLNVPRETGRVLERIYSLPLIDGVPIQFRFANRKKQANLVLETNDCEKKTVGASTFQLPKTYRQVYNEREVTLAHGGQEYMNDFLEDMDKHIGKKK